MKTKVFVLTLLFISSFFVISYKEDILKFLKIILEFKDMNIYLCFFVFIAFLFRWIFTKDIENLDSGIIYRDFGFIADIFFAFLTYSLSLTTSVAILKALLLQKVFETGIYFTNLDELDIYSMIIVSLFLLGYSTNATIKSIIFTFKVSNSKAITAG